jgi:hypothetical protein
MRPTEPTGLESVRDFMLSMFCISEGRGWATLTEIAGMTGVHETYVPAILGHLHKTRYGSYIVDKRHRENVGTYEYRVRTRASLRRLCNPKDPERGSASSIARLQVRDSAA